MTHLHIRNGRFDPSRSEVIALVGYEPEQRYPTFYRTFRSDGENEAMELAAEEIARKFDLYGPKLRLLLIPVCQQLS